MATSFGNGQEVDPLGAYGLVLARSFAKSCGDNVVTRIDVCVSLCVCEFHITCWRSGEIRD